MVGGLPGGIVDWGIFQRCEGASRETGLELVKIRRLVGVYSAPDPRIHSICILVEAEVDGKMKVQDTLEVIEIGFPPISASGQLSHDHNQQLQDYFDGLTKLA